MLFTDWYEPGFKAGGPIRSAVNFVQQMQKDYDIYIFTSDRDLNEDNPYSLIVSNTWINISVTTKVFYASPDKLNYTFIKRQIDSVGPDFVYLNSMFSLKFTLYPLWISRPKNSLKVILAPRGMLKKSALEFKAFKKKIFLTIFRKTGLARNIYFHATDPSEIREIQYAFGEKARAEFIPNFSASVGEYASTLFKHPGKITIAFVGRVHPVKNLAYLLEVLKSVKGRISLEIIGEIEDQLYYEHCKQIALSLNTEIKVQFHGSIPAPAVKEKLLACHILALPTVGENFGHSIFESLSLGKPVVISNNTPWKDLERNLAGFDIALQDKPKFIQAMQFFTDMDNEEYKRWSLSAWQYVSSKHDNKKIKEKYIQLFS